MLPLNKTEDSFHEDDEIYYFGSLDKGLDVGYILVFIGIFSWHMWSLRLIFKEREMRNLYNYLIITANLLCLVNRIICLIYWLVYKDKGLIERRNMSHYFFY